MRMFGTSIVCLLIVSPAASQEIQVFETRLNKVENPSALDKVGTILNTREVQAAAKAAAGLLYGIPPETVDRVVGIANTAVHYDATKGTTSTGYIQSPAGYTICQAEWMNPSLTCNNTFNASYRRARPNGQGIDGLHWQMVVNKPPVLESVRCWVDGTVKVTFVKPELREKYHCQPYGYCAWLEGPKDKGRNVKCGVPEEG
jgi:hypothetical protein